MFCSLSNSDVSFDELSDLKVVGRTPIVSRLKFDYLCNCVAINEINVKKLQFIHTVNGDGSKTAKVIKRQC